MKDADLSPELRALLDRTPVLTEADIQELAEANRALERDPEFVADFIKGLFVNDILCAMEEQGLNKNQLAEKWGKSRQHVGQILDLEKSKNFTIDTIVSLSMTLGLVPQRIKLQKMAVEPAVEDTESPSMLKVAEAASEPYGTQPAKNRKRNPSKAGKHLAPRR